MAMILLGSVLTLQGVSSRAQEWSRNTTVQPATPQSVAPMDNAFRDFWVLTLSPYTYHWTDDPQYTHVILAGLERHRANGSFTGLSLFRNSFGQPSAYLYYGWQWNNAFKMSPAIYAKLSLGVIYGYLPPYDKKVPFNYHGFSPGIVPAIGYRLNHSDALQINVLGKAGLMFSYERTF